MAFPKADGSINGGIGGGKDGYSGHVTFYVEVPDLEAALSKIEGLGGGTVMPPDQVTGWSENCVVSRPRGPRHRSRSKRSWMSAMTERFV